MKAESSSSRLQEKKHFGKRLKSVPSCSLVNADAGVTQMFSSWGAPGVNSDVTIPMNRIALHPSEPHLSGPKKLEIPSAIHTSVQSTSQPPPHCLLVTTRCPVHIYVTLCEQCHIPFPLEHLRGRASRHPGFH